MRLDGPSGNYLTMFDSLFSILSVEGMLLFALNLHSKYQVPGTGSLHSASPK